MLKNNNNLEGGPTLTQRVPLAQRLRDAGFKDVAAHWEREDAKYRKQAHAIRENGSRRSVDCIIEILRARDEL